MNKTASEAMGGCRRYFSATYGDARRDFLRATTDNHLAVETRALPADTGVENEVLATDAVLLGPANAASLLVLSSGTHGIEGFAGSAIQRALFDDNPLHTLLRDRRVAVLLVHAVNPYGFSYWSRTTEDNVDVNRNGVDFREAMPANLEYEALHELLIPSGWPPSAANAAALGEYVERYGVAAFQNAVTAGQYAHPDGMFYGGVKTGWSVRTMTNLLECYGDGRERVGWIDIHTGLGPAGHGEKICVAPGGAPELRRARSWWGCDVTSPLDSSTVAARVAGPLTDILPKVCPKSITTSMALEYGTVELMDMLQVLRADAWLRKNPDAPTSVHASIRRQMREAFCPDDRAWEGGVLGQARVAIIQAIHGLSGVD